MAQALERHAPAETRSPSRPSDPSRAEIARALFAEHLDLEAIRRALGQPRGRDAADPEDHAAPPPRAAEPAPEVRSAPLPSPPQTRSWWAVAAMMAVGTTGLVTGGLLAIELPGTVAPVTISSDAPRPAAPREASTGLTAPPLSTRAPGIVAEMPPRPVAPGARLPGNAPTLVASSEFAGVAGGSKITLAMAPGGALSAPPPTPPRELLPYPAPPSVLVSPSEEVARPVVAREIEPVAAPAPPAPASLPAKIVALDPPARAVQATPAAARVVIHYDRRVWSARPEGLAERLRAAGFGRVEWRPVELGIGASQTRFFHAADGGLSGRVAQVLAQAGRPVSQRDFTHFSPPPSPGTIEVWLAR
jgi:hypothetical protein